MAKKGNDPASRMARAREISCGTLPLRVEFETREEVAEAEAWKKGKRNVAHIEAVFVGDVHTLFPELEPKKIPHPMLDKTRNEGD